MSDVARVCYLCGGVPEAPYGRLDVSLRDAVEGVLGRAVPSLAVDDDDDDNDDDDPSPCCKTCLGLAEELDRLRRRLREVEEQIRRRDKRKILHAKLKEPYRREGEAGMVDRRHFEMTLKEFVAAGMCQYCCQSTSVSTEEEEDQRLAAVVHKCRVPSVSGRPFRCPACLLPFKTFQTRQRHCLALHFDDAPYGCVACHRRFRVAAKLREHESSCLRGVRHRCQVCESTFVSRRNLADHMNTVHERGAETRKHKCHHCPKSFSKHCNLSSHELAHSSDRPHSCSIPGCGRSFKRAKALTAHVRRAHAQAGGRPEYLCQDCGKNFASITGMRQHSKREHGGVPPSRPHTCGRCEKTFRCLSDLKIHSVVHTREKPYDCQDCGAAFSQKATLKAHRNVHLQTFQCEGCQKSFSRARYLEQHARTCKGGENSGEGEKGEDCEEEKMPLVMATTVATPAEGGIGVTAAEELLSTAQTLTQMGTVTFIRCSEDDD